MLECEYSQQTIRECHSIDIVAHCDSLRELSSSVCYSHRRDTIYCVVGIWCSRNRGNKHNFGVSLLSGQCFITAKGSGTGVIPEIQVRSLQICE